MRDAAKELLSLIDDEYDAIMSGDIEMILKLGEIKIKLLENLEHNINESNDTTLQHISTLSIRNNELLEAARSGIRSARERIYSIGRGDIHKTYTSDGQMEQLHLGHQSIERKF